MILIDVFKISLRVYLSVSLAGVEMTIDIGHSIAIKISNKYVRNRSQLTNTIDKTYKFVRKPFFKLITY